MEVEFLVVVFLVFFEFEVVEPLQLRRRWGRLRRRRRQLVMVIRVHALVFSLCAATALAQGPVPQITSPVMDLANVLAPSEAATLTAELEAHRQATGVQLAVITIDSINGEAIESWTLRTAAKWGGGEKGRDDGGLFVLVIKDRLMRIELGYGLEGRVTDVQAELLLQNAKGLLRQGDTAGAVRRVTDGLISLTREGTMSAEEQARFRASKESAPIPDTTLPWVIYAGVFLVFSILGKWAKSRREQYRPQRVNPWLGLSLLSLGVGVAANAAGFGYMSGGAALCGSIAGLTFFFSEFIMSVLYPMLIGVSTIMVASVEPDLIIPLSIAAHLVITLSFVAIVTDVAIGLLAGAATYSSSGASSRGSSRGSSSRSSSSSGSSSSGSSGSNYDGGGGGFGGGGASSSW